MSSDPHADLERHYPTDSWEEDGMNAYGCVKQLYLLKKANRHLKVLLSIGGWEYSPTLSKAASTNTTRAAFASSAVNLITDWGFDGIDIDWEWHDPPPTQTDATNFVLLLQAVRAALDKASTRSCSNYRFLLTVAAPAGPTIYNALDLNGMAEYTDFFNLKAYDYTGSFSSFSGHQANLYANPNNSDSTPFSTDNAITDYLQRGVPARKIVLGMPAYGRSFRNTSGIGQVFMNTNNMTDVYKYNALPKYGATENIDLACRASYSFDFVSGELVSYDTVPTVQMKTTYIQRKKLAGSMLWEASGDRNGSHSLIAASYAALGKIDMTLNLLSYPLSRYSNIAAGMPEEQN
ncbi:hypothetical protein S7711_09992 [Stachybotrys chartarum IBT 7711]|uniref:chitinase n=1 Tax=Stachybotrys chartarum (strain CBS 109288 / IBT 7711) TaxID=1280523 RepID=A0A084B782_STACB|nr:hypothetical protein S7711_09992 [Stachybotrys chartarum IBT 7711]